MRWPSYPLKGYYRGQLDFPQQRCTPELDFAKEFTYAKDLKRLMDFDAMTVYAMLTGMTKK